MSRTAWLVALAVLVGGGAIQVGAVARRHSPHDGWWGWHRAGQTPATALAAQAQTAQGTTSGQSTSQPGQRGGRPGGPPNGIFGADRNGPPQNPSPASVGWEWWKDADVKKEIGLRPDQASRIDDFYASRIKDMAPAIEKYQKENELLDKMLAERTVNQATLNLQITTFNSLKGTISQSRILMLYRISKVLDSDQYAKLKAIFDRRIKEMEQHRGRGGAPAPEPSGLRR